MLKEQEHNKIMNLPNLQNTLKVLNLRHTQLKNLPDSIGKFKKLQHLNLSKNKLVILPASIGNLSKLKTLNLSENPITTLPSSMKDLEKLETLDLRSTPKLRELVADKLVGLHDLKVIWQDPIKPNN